ncbi:hypothetical protein ACRQ5D_28150 [Mucilaginibacter sp. P25]|uniref:hypothetical protein n=1 Tax=unclassified Mucilaginibacter TaxID=2617802 RepID=UPI003D665563
MKLILSILFISLSAVTIAQELPATHYKIYSTSAQKIITPDDIVNDMANADALFLAKSIMIQRRTIWSLACSKSFRKNIRRKRRFPWRCFKLTVSWC